MACICLQESISTLLSPQSVVSALFSARTSEIQFAVVERVEVGEGILDQICCEPHGRFYTACFLTGSKKGFGGEVELVAAEAYVAYDFFE